MMANENSLFKLQIADDLVRLLAYSNIGETLFSE